jgi:hypothetical protein
MSCVALDGTGRRHESRVWSFSDCAKDFLELGGVSEPAADESHHGVLATGEARGEGGVVRERRRAISTSSTKPSPELAA